MYKFVKFILYSVAIQDHYPNYPKSPPYQDGSTQPGSAIELWKRGSIYLFLFF